MTNSTGNLLPPGSGSGVVAMTRTPEIALTFPKTSPTICSVDAFPLAPWFGHHAGEAECRDR